MPTDHETSGLTPELPADNHALIRPEHKRKYAVVYARQSTPDQVLHHSGSTDSQLALREQAKRLGWPESLIKVIDQDLGLSGTSSPQRAGFQDLLAMMKRLEVGIVLVRDIARLSRDPLDAERFLVTAISAEVLIEVNGQVYDPASRDLAALFGLRIQALLAWFDNAQRVATFKKAKEAKIRRGFAVSRPPIGYVESVKGKWVQDPDIAIREAVRRVFDLYLARRSIHKVATSMRDGQQPFPKRKRGEIHWDVLSPLGVLRVLTNPNYTGDYHFRRRRLLPKDDTGNQRLVPVPAGDWIVARDHHDGYVTRSEWQSIQQTLHGQGRGPRRQPPAGGGSGVLQGLVV
jgi:DNA invertase Pin-like site-specific DNA recombinase